LGTVSHKKVGKSAAEEKINRIDMARQDEWAAKKKML